MIQPSEEHLINLLLPAGLLTYFTVVKTRVDNLKDRIDIWLDERPNPPVKQGKRYISKGFTPENSIQDFPIRGKGVYLHLRKRKWQDVDTGQIITQSYDLSSDGTRLSKEFAAFLKENGGIHPDELQIRR